MDKTAIREGLLKRLDEVKPLYRDGEDGLDVERAIDHALREFAVDEPDEYRFYANLSPAELLRVWNNQRDQGKRHKAKVKFGEDYVDQALGAPAQPTLDGRAPKELLELEFTVHTKSGQRKVRLGDMIGEQRREVEERYGREERRKRGYRMMFHELNKRADAERDRRGLTDDANLWTIFGHEDVG